MLRKARSAEGVVAVTFTVSASVAGHAEHVHFVGEPTGWIPVPMHHNPDGSFELTIELAAGGRYAFRYRLDERWYNDDAADDYTPNQYGGHNAIVTT